MRTPLTVVNNQVIRVTRGTISTSVKTTGKIAPVQSSLVSFTKQGTITKISKKVGDPVRAGDVIAEVDASSVSMDIRNAQISLENARNNYTKLFAATTESDRIRAKNTLEESKNALSLLEAQYQDLLTTQKNALAESEDQLSLLKDKVSLAESDLDYTKKHIDSTTDATNLERDIANAFLTIEEISRFFPDTLKSLREKLYIENKNSSYYGDLGSKNTTNKIVAERSYLSIKTDIGDYDLSLSKMRTEKIHSLDSVLEALAGAQSILSDMNTLASLTTSLYTDTPAGGGFTQTDIETTQTSLRTLGSTIGTKLSGVNTTTTTLRNYGTDEIQALSDKNTIASKEQALKSAKNELEKAERSYEALKTSQMTEKISRQNEIIRSKNSITLNEATYNEMSDGPLSTDENSAKNSINSAQISLEKARLALRDYQIIAPFDGVIGDIPWSIGDVTTSTEGVLIENKNAYEITLSLDQIDIVKIQEGMRTDIVLDAFPTVTYTGTVTRVSAVPIETSGVVSYTAIVELMIPRTDIYNKMSVTVEIITTQKDNIITIPTSAISTESGKSYVDRALDPAIFGRLMSANMSSSGAFVGRGFSGGSRGGNLSGSGGTFPFRERNSSGGLELSGTIRTSSGMENRLGTSGGGRGARSGNFPNVTTSETIPTEKIEITTGVSSDGKTEVISGLSVGDVIVILGKTPTKSTSANTTSSSSTSTRRGGGFGGPPPGF